MAYAVIPRNTSDKTTLADFIECIEQPYGKVNRTWVMERGIPAEETPKIMRDSDPPVHYLVGMPIGRLSRLDRPFLTLPWETGAGSGPSQTAGTGGRTLGADSS